MSQFELAFSSNIAKSLTSHSFVVVPASIANSRSAVEFEFPEYMGRLCDISKLQAEFLFGGQDTKPLITVARRVAEIQIQNEKQRKGFDEFLTLLEERLIDANEVIHRSWRFEDSTGRVRALKYYGKRTLFHLADNTPTLEELKAIQKGLMEAHTAFRMFVFSIFPRKNQKTSPPELIESIKDRMYKQKKGKK